MTLSSQNLAFRYIAFLHNDCMRDWESTVLAVDSFLASCVLAAVLQT